MDGGHEALKSMGFDEAMFWERKPLTVPQIEKVVGKKVLADMEGKFWEKAQGSPTLVRDTDKREIYTNRTTVEEAFN